MTLSYMPGEPVIHVIVADDHPVVRHGVIAELSSHTDIEVVGEAVNAYEAVRYISQLQAHVLLLDINMPGPNTLEILKHVRSLAVPPQVLVLTAHNDAEYIMTVLKAGAKGYILKDETLSTITTAVRAVARGETWLSPSVIVSVVNRSVQEPEKDMPILSERESEVLEQLILGKENQEISDALFISERTVRFHLRNIYDKLGVRRRGEAIIWGLQEYLPAKKQKQGMV